MEPGQHIGAEEEAARDGGTALQRHGRRLSDKILAAFHHACDVNDLEVADELLRLVEMMLARRPAPPDNGRRRAMGSLVAAHERLWFLRHPVQDD